MATTSYHFIDRWRVRASIEEVAEIFKDGPDMARWWPSTYREVAVLRDGDENGIGQEGSVRAKGWLPYAIHFNYRVTDSWHPNGFAIETWGDLTGRGEWRFAQDGPFVDLTYDWRISADKALLRYLSFMLKPVFRSNHNWTMRVGEASLELELARRRATSPEAAARVAAPPGPAGTGPLKAALALALCVAGGIWIGKQLRRPLRVSHAAIINRPVAEVFAFVTRVENDLRWQPEIEEVTITSPLPLGAGSTFREVRTTLGRRFIWEMLITAFEQDRRICIESVGGATPYSGCRTFEAVPGGTRITETSEAWLPPYLRPLNGLFARLSRVPVAGAYARLKALLEAGA